MARSTRLYSINEAARLMGENLELVEEATNNSDNVEYGEMLHIDDGSECGQTVFTERGIESVAELIKDIRTWEGGIRAFLVDQQCDPEMIERVMADEAKRAAHEGSPLPE